MQNNFYITIYNNDGENGTWTVPEQMFEVFKNFMLALESGNEDKVIWRGDANLGTFVVQPRLLLTGVVMKIPALRELRQHYHFTLKEAKSWVDRAPVYLPPLSYGAAKALQASFVANPQWGTIELPNALEQLVTHL